MSGSFYVVDETTHTPRLSHGTAVPEGPLTVSELDLSQSSDSYAVVPLTPECCVLTGNGNDSINIAWSTGPSFVDAGAGMNFIYGNSSNDTIQVDASSTRATYDVIHDFHAGDCLSLMGGPQGGWTLNWMQTAGGTLMTAAAPGAQPIAVDFAGVSRAQLFTTLGARSENVICLAHS